MKPADVDVPPGWTHAGWVDEYGNLWSLLLRNGAVESDRPVFVPPFPPSVNEQEDAAMRTMIHGGP